ncbi:MAG: HNH endonuclease [Cyclobacteriaceae bacterium]|nr:HNH endonuclease [Cyclobacteriaceae bacterium]
MRLKFYLLGCVFFIASYVNAQTYFYNTYNVSFNISGTTSVCADNTTVYTYYGTYSNLNWSVNGGTIQGPSTGASINVIWNSANGSIEASGSWTEENCWYEPDIYPPTMYCNVDTYNATSNAFAVSSMINFNSFTGSGAYCAGGSTTLALNGSQTGVNYQLRLNGTNTGSAVAGTGSAISWANITAPGTYSIRATRTSPSCSVILPSTINVTAVSASGGSVAGSASVCVTGSGSLTLSGHSGSIVRWEQNNGGGWTNISNTTTNLNYSNVTITTQYRAWVVNAPCAGVYSSIATVTVSSNSVGGTLPGNSQHCNTATGTLTLTGHTGNVVRWEQTTGSGWTTITNTTSTLNYTNLTVSTTYRAVVKNGACSEVYSSLSSVSISPLSVPGTLTASAEVYGASATGTLTLTGNNANVTRWEKNTGSGWATIAHTGTSYNFNQTQTTSYRAVVKSGVCAEAASNQVTITLYPTPVITPNEPGTIAYGTTVLLTANAPYHTRQWYLNGNAIVGATGQTHIANQPGLYFVQVKGSATAPAANSATVRVKGLTEGYQNSMSAVSTTTILQENVTEATSLHTLPNNKVAQVITYLDGLGRPFQTVAIGSSPAGGDVISHNPASKYGIQDSTYLPYAIALRDGHYRPNAIRGSTSHTSYTTSEQYLFYQNTTKVAQSTHPFARTVTANDPTFRVTEQGAPGVEWQPGSNHTVRSQSALNNSTNYRVRYWNHLNGITSANYPDRSVSVSIVTDENGNKVQTYTDARGLTVLKQVQIDETLEGEATAWLETYYVYDRIGRLTHILPPKAMKVLGTGTSLDANNPAIAELIHKFTYDGKNRLVEKKVPGAAVQFIVYDQHDRVVLTQDGNQRSTNKWMFVKYDFYNRPVYTGIYTNTTQVARVNVQGLLDAQNYATTPWYESEGTTVHGYTNLAFPTSGTVANTILSVTYYDHYNFDRTAGDDFTYDAAHLSGQEPTRSQRTRNLATGSKRNVLDAVGNTTAYWITAAVFYDKYDRPIQTQSNNHLHTGFTAATLDKATIIYDFVKALKTKSSHYQNATTAVHLEDWNDFDHAGRVLKTYRKINGGATQLVAQYEYNALGQVVDKKLHNTTGTDFLQSVDFRYNIRGWLSSINNAQLNVNVANNDETTDYFGMELLYQATESGLSNTQYYNGNISAIKWKGLGTTGAVDQRSYKYQYDKSDRLKSATFQAYTGAAWTKEAGTLNEAQTYDVNGNIKTLTRSRNLRSNTGITITATPETFDNLTYTYANNLDKLTKVEDAAAVSAGFLNGVNTTTEYGYNTDGSLTVDNNKGISSIAYNLLGKPQVINFTSGKKIEYIYDAAGVKLTMRTYQGATLLTTTNYSGNFVYEGTSPVLSFFGSPEGRIVKNGANFEYQYAIADHQGNTRVVFTSATPAPEAKTANMEAAANSDFLNYTNRIGFNLFDKTDAGTTFTYAQKLTGGNNAQVGVAKSYKVYAGDKVKIEAWAKYQNPSSTSSNISGFASALFAAFGVPTPAGGESGTASSALNIWGGLVVGGNGGTSTGPKAFVNIIVFDKNYKLLDAAWEAVDPAANQVGASPVVPHDYMMREYTAKEEGYVFMYVSNESPTLVDVYFDDVVMTHTKGNVVQYNEYYPFGLQTANSWTRENTTGNNFLGNGGTELNQTSQLYDLDYRNYDPILGRMNGVDPMATKYASLSPYNFSFNDPVTFTDPSGADPHQDWLAEQAAMQEWFDRTNPLPMDPGGGVGGAAYYNSMMGGYGVAGMGWNPNFSVLNTFYPHFGNSGQPTYCCSYTLTDPTQISIFINAVNAGGSVTLNSQGFWTHAEGQYVNTRTGEVLGDFEQNTFYEYADGVWQMAGTRDKSNWKPSVFDRAPSGLDTYVPIWGSGRQAAFWFGEGDVSRGVLYTALAVSDVFLVKAAVTALARVGVTAATKGVASGAQYSVAYEMKLSTKLYPGGSYRAHFQAANKSLNTAMASDAIFAKSMSRLGVSIPHSSTGSILGKSPANWVWHHDVGAGVMQLVPKSQHTTGSIFWNTLHPGGVGGMSIWNK